MSNAVERELVELSRAHPEIALFISRVESGDFNAELSTRFDSGDVDYIVEHADGSGFRLTLVGETDQGDELVIDEVFLAESDNEID